MRMGKQIIKAENVSMQFNMATEKIDNIKEYFVKKVKGRISYDTLWALRNVNFQMDCRRKCWACWTEWKRQKYLP